jgi:hypothetical protein
MNQEVVKLQIPFKTLIDIVAGLSPQDKYRLWAWLEREIDEVDETLWEQAPVIQAEIQEARAAYQAGDYVTLDDYVQTMNNS